MNIIEKIERENMRMDMPQFRSGDNVKVHLRIVEGEKERIQVFQGNVIRVSRGTTNASFTVRKISEGVGVERIFPVHPTVEPPDATGGAESSAAEMKQKPPQFAIREGSVAAFVTTYLASALVDAPFFRPT